MPEHDRPFALRCAVELLRIFAGYKWAIDHDAFAQLERSDPPLVYRSDLMAPLVTDDGLRVASKLVDVFLEET